MKKIFIIFILSFLCLTVVGCSSINNTDDISYNLSANGFNVTYPYNTYDKNIGAYPLFSESLLPVENSSELYGYINSSGEEVIECQYLSAERFNEYGYARVEVEEDYFNIIDLDGAYLFTENLQSVGELHFLEDVIIVDYLWNNTSFDTDIFDYNGTLLVHNPTNSYLNNTYPRYFLPDDIFIVNSMIEGGVILCDENWNKISEYVYDSMRWSYRGFLEVYNTKNCTTEFCGWDQKNFGLVDSSGSEFLPPIYANTIRFGADVYKSDIAPIITQEYRLGFIDYTGNIIIEPIYDVSNFGPGAYNTFFNMNFDFNHGVQKVPDGDIYKIIDYLGNVLFETNENQYIADYDDQLIAVKTKIFEEDNEYNYLLEIIDYNGNVLYSGLNNDVIFTSDASDIFFIEKEFDWTVNVTGVDMYNYQGELIKSEISLLKQYKYYYDDEEWTGYANFFNGVMTAYDNESRTIGFIDESGNWVVNPQFDLGNRLSNNMEYYLYHTDGFSVVYKDGYYGIIDLEGNVIVDIIYKSIPCNTFNRDDLLKDDLPETLEKK